MMKNIITEQAAAGDGQSLVILASLRARDERSNPLIVLLHKWHSLTRIPSFAYSVLLMCLLSVSFNLSAQSIPILTFDKFEKFLKPENDSIYVINFWATWCMPCVEELPAFEKLNDVYKNQKVKVMLVSLDFKSQYNKKVVPFVKKNKLNSEVILLDTEGKNDFIDKVSPQWQGSIPATLILQADSKTQNFYERKFTYDELEKIVKPLIRTGL